MIKNTAQIVATIGPASDSVEIFTSMVKNGLSIVRFNFSWGDFPTRIKQIEMIRAYEKECGYHIPIIQDLPGPRIQQGSNHTYDNTVIHSITEEDKVSIQFGIEHDIDYIALSFVGGKADVEMCRDILATHSGKQKIIAKIERKIALEAVDEIIASADGIMIARGDLGEEIPLEQIPFAEAMIIKKCKAAGKPVIVATQMMLSMTDSPTPTRAEVTDVAYAILEGADATMLSEETARGKYPVEAVTIMRKVITESERNLIKEFTLNPLH